jgi:DNA (cytosine-5)-methyltransferase 1
VRFGSLFSGVEAASAAWLPLGWECAWVAEIDPFACAVLKHRYPSTPNLGDVNEIEPGAVEPVGLIVFGSPCQSFSVAGKRLGLDDPRGNMALVGLRLVGRIRPRWVVWENVPGVLSSDGGRDFGAFLGLLGELGYGFAYRVLDAQHAGVPQRRRRVFVVGCLGGWRPAAAVLFEPESLRGDTPPRREAGQGVADPITRSFAKHGGASAGKDSVLRNFAFGGNNTAGPIDVATACNAHGGPHGRQDFESETLIAGHFEQNSMGGRGTLGWNEGEGPLRPVKPQGDHQMLVTHSLDSCSAGRATEDGTGRGCPLVTHSLRADGFDASEDGTGRGTPLVALNLRGREGGSQFEQDDLASLRAASGGSSRSYIGGMSVRRLTPAECEKLQGFEPGYTAIPYRGKPAADGPRYRAIGNSMAVPVIRWIGQRIQQFEDMQTEMEDAAD